uniref:Uncharacterized protein n=1 Tax=Amphimedon queenslandica TaxID=400682 RepID=A0A1X7VF75_AMPQE
MNFKIRHKKLRCRTIALNSSTSLSNEEKEKYSSIMTLDFISSEESASDSEDCRTFVIRPLPWISEEVKSIMASLDRKSQRRRSERGTEMMVKRKVGMNSSERECPEDCATRTHT